MANGKEGKVESKDTCLTISEPSLLKIFLLGLGDVFGAGLADVVERQEGVEMMSCRARSIVKCVPLQFVPSLYSIMTLGQGHSGVRWTRGRQGGRDGRAHYSLEKKVPLTTTEHLRLPRREGEGSGFKPFTEVIESNPKCIPLVACFVCEDVCRNRERGKMILVRIE